MLLLNWGDPVADSALTATAISPGNFVVGALISQVGKATTQVLLSITVPAGADPTWVFVGVVRDINGTAYETPTNIGAPGALIQPLSVPDRRAVMPGAVPGVVEPINVPIDVPSTIGAAFRTFVLNATDFDRVVAGNAPITATSVYRQA